VIPIKLELRLVAYFICHAVQEPSHRRLPAKIESRPESIQGEIGMNPAYKRPGWNENRHGMGPVLRSLLAAGALVGLLFHAAPCAKRLSASSRPSRENGVVQVDSKTPAAHGVDTAKVHRLYIEGDFDEAISLLEANLKDSLPYRHEDSVFIFKHLGVMYAAQYDTRDRGTYFMHRLLQVEPTAKIMDMYASDMIYMIFKNIQEEYEQNRMQMSARYPERNGRAGTADSAASGTSDTPAGSEPAAKGSHKKAWIWTGAAVAAVAAGVGAYYLIASEPSTEVQPHPVSQ
jgi:hypothetical protein